MMLAVLQNLSSASKNRHVSIPIAMAVACEVGKIWMPGYEHQWDATQKCLFGYGILAAGNTGPEKTDSTKTPQQQPAQQGNTQVQ